MVPVLALVGRPNVGKSTLFNALTRSRDALVANFPGLTRDRQYGKGELGEQNYLVIDTGGLTGGEEGVELFMASQAKQAIAEADATLFMVDGRAGCTTADEAIAEQLRKDGRKVFLIVNKTDGIDPDVACGDFYRLGLGEPIPIAAAHQRGLRLMIEEVLAGYVDEDAGESDEEGDNIKVAIIGRPNVGKSTLVNRIIGEERVVVFDMPGTTRDSIYIPFERDEQKYTLIDTAGVRRRARVKETVEKFSVIKTLKAIEDAHVVVMVLDAHEGIADQDAHILGLIIQAGRALLLAVNKWDGMKVDERDWIKKTMDHRFPYLNYAKHHYISALHGSGVGNLFESIQNAYHSAMIQLPTPKLTDLLTSLVQDHQPPLVRGRRIKLRYAHQGGKNPPIIVIHGNQTDDVPLSYRRYLENSFRQHLKLTGTPIRIEFKGSSNPYAGRKNQLSPSQVKNRQRLVQFSKKREQSRSKRR